MACGQPMARSPIRPACTISMANTTQFNADTARSIPTQDGYATGQITNLTIDGTGILLANFSNDQTKAIGQISLAELHQRARPASQ